jgi:hypothetical protein
MKIVNPREAGIVGSGMDAAAKQGSRPRQSWQVLQFDELTSHVRVRRRPCQRIAILHLRDES